MKRLITLCSITLALSAFAGVTARYTFDDAGNGGLNLLKASVGEDAIVRGGKPAADVSGIGELYDEKDRMCVSCMASYTIHTDKADGPGRAL